MPYALIPDGGDEPERLTGDDLATKREEEFLAAALREQQARSAMVKAQPGTCANCGEACLPRAVYCDPDCRSDHEARMRKERQR